MHEPQYSTYTLEELTDSLKHIDKEAFPTRAKSIELEIEQRKAGVPPKQVVKTFESHSSPSKIEKGKKSARGIVLAIWPATVFFSIFYGKLPSRNGLISYQEEPGLFVTSLIIFIGVGFYFYHGRDDV